MFSQDASHLKFQFKEDSVPFGMWLLDSYNCSHPNSLPLKQTLWNLCQDCRLAKLTSQEVTPPRQNFDSADHFGVVHGWQRCEKAMHGEAMKKWREWCFVHEKLKVHHNWCCPNIPTSHRVHNNATTNTSWFISALSHMDNKDMKILRDPNDWTVPLHSRDTFHISIWHSNGRGNLCVDCQMWSHSPSFWFCCMMMWCSNWCLLFDHSHKLHLVHEKCLKSMSQLEPKKGWITWHHCSQINTLFFVEVNCTANVDSKCLIAPQSRALSLQILKHLLCLC